MAEPGPGYETILYRVEDGIGVVTLNRPEKLNAFTAGMGRELEDVLEVVDADDAVRVLVVTGSGRAFCAGADLSAGGGTFAERGERSTVGVGTRDGGGRVSLRIFDCKKPVIAAFNGPAVGVGVTMTLPMDIRLASTTARFGFVFNRRGIIPEAASSWFLPRLVGISRAAEWVFTGRVFEAEEALAGGLVRSIHPPEELLPVAMALGREIAENTAPVSVALSRQMLWRLLGAAHPMEAHKIDSRGMLVRGSSPDAREGVTSFLEKRPPRFPMKVSQDLPDLFPDWGPPTFD
jgi:enoyl-CoA hydratase/carnithine racemase